MGTEMFYVVGVWCLDGSYAITGVFDNEPAAQEAANTIEDQWSHLVKDIVIDSYDRNTLLTPGADIPSREELEDE